MQTCVKSEMVRQRRGRKKSNGMSPARSRGWRRSGLACVVLAAVALLASGCSIDDEAGEGANYNYGNDTSTSYDAGYGSDTAQGGNTNVNIGGAQDFGYFRRLLADNIVPQPEDLDPAGFFAEHHTPLPEPDCGNQVCVQAMLGVMANMLNGANCTMLQIGLNSPIVADPANRPPLQLAVVVDVSGSMQDAGKMDFVIQGLERMINELDDTDEIAIVTYSSDAQVVSPLAPVGGARNELLDIVRGLRANGRTNIYDGLEAGYNEILGAYDSGVQNRVILLSDGVPTAGIESEGEIVSMSRAYNSEGVGLTTVGLGTDFNLSLMQTLSEQSDGNFYFVEDSSAVDEVFQQELSYFTVPVAFDVRIEVEAGQHYTFGEASGSNLWVDTETGGYLEVPSVFLAHRVSDDDVTQDGSERRGGGSALLLELMPRAEEDPSVSEAQVATVTFSYREPGSDEIVTEVVEVGYPYAPWELLTEGFFDNAIVTKSFVMLNIFAAMREATNFWHQGQEEEAIALLRRVIAAAADYEDSANDGTGDVDIQLDIELMQQLIDVMLANGATEPENPEIPDDPWPRD